MGLDDVKWYYMRMLSEVGKGGVKECMERYEMNVRWSLVDGRGADELFVSACMPISAIVVFRKVGERWSLILVCGSGVIDIGCL